MARRTRTQRLNICLNARFVGRLEKAGSGAVSFAYDAGWPGRVQCARPARRACDSSIAFS